MAENEKVATAVEIHVFVNRKKVTFTQLEVTGQQILAAAGFTGSGWDLLKLQGEGDPTGGTLILSNQVVELKNGEHFRVIPGNRTFGAAQ
jgi:hypothetical protein